jgi:DNA-binding HxlR family transcriptional regulator
MIKLNPTLHQTLRLAIVSFLATVEHSDFKQLLEITGSTKGNLSAQLSKLEASKYVEIKKSFRGKYPHTEYNLTKKGRSEFENYINQLKQLLHL